MADVMGRTADRGQLLLITALALAVLLVTVALLLNAAIFTENVATRDSTTEGAEAIELRGEVVAAVGDLIETENRQGGGDTADVENSVDDMDPLVVRERARHGVIATLSRNGSATRGQLLRWDSPDSPRPFDADGSNWTLVEGVDTARNFTLDLDPSTLESATAATSDSGFGVRFNRSGDTVTQYIYEEDGTLSVAEAVNGGTPKRQCRIDPNGTTTVDLTGDHLSTDGSAVDCYRGLWPDDDPDAIEVVNGEDAEGTFAVTVDDGAMPTATTAVQHPDVVYSVTVDIVYRSADLVFETTVRVAPGEPR